MPTKLLDVDVNPAALINTLDDGPMGYPEMVADAQPDEVMRGYRLLACNVVTLALADIARQAAKEASVSPEGVAVPVDAAKLADVVRHAGDGPQGIRGGCGTVDQVRGN